MKIIADRFGSNVQILDDKGKAIALCLTAIHIDPILPNKPITAHMDVINVELDVKPDTVQYDYGEDMERKGE